MVQKLTWSGSYPRSTFTSDIIHKVLKLVSLKATVTKIYVTNMITLIYKYYASMVVTLNHTNSLKLKDHLGKNITYFCGLILVDAERLNSAEAFNPEHLGYIIRIFEETSDSVFHLWATQEYKGVMEFIENISVYGKYVMRPDKIMTSCSLFQEAMCEYHNIVDSMWW